MKTITSKSGKAVLKLDISEDMIFINHIDENGNTIRRGVLNEGYYEPMNYKLKD